MTWDREFVFWGLLFWDFADRKVYVDRPYMLCDSSVLLA